MPKYIIYKNEDDKINVTTEPYGTGDVIIEFISSQKQERMRYLRHKDEDVRNWKIMIGFNQ